MPKLTYTKFGDTHTTDTDTLVAAALEYLFDYGFKQSMGDSHAGSAKKVEKAWADAGRDPATDKATFEAEVIAQSRADMEIRFNKIVAGTMNVNDSDPLRAIAVEMLRKNAASKGTKLPDGKSPAYRDLVSSVLEKHRVAIQKEYDRRKKNVIEIEL